MENRQGEAQYYKERIQDFSKYNEDELYKFFKAVKYGIIVMSYPNSLEKDIYRYVASILKKRYPNYCDEEDVVNTLSSYGNIYTAKIDKGLDSGIYHINSANILIYSFLNKLNESLVHELIHKLGFLKFNDDFYNMPKIYVESGTEIITNSALNKPICRELLLGKMWVRSVGVQPRYLIESALVNQLNVACGKESLERSIFEGKNYIEPEVKQLIGEEKYMFLFTMLTDICRLEKSYWKSQKSKTIESLVSTKIDRYQKFLLEEIFGKRIEQVENEKDAEAILIELMKFSDYRVKSSREDEEFKQYFQSKKQLLEGKFNTLFNIEDVSDTWKERHPSVMLDESILKSEETEKRKIDSMAEKKEGKKKGFLARLFGSKKQAIGDDSENKLLERKSFEYEGNPVNPLLETNEIVKPEIKEIEEK